jgi:hypothetical protein
VSWSAGRGIFQDEDRTSKKKKKTMKNIAIK